MTDAPEDAQPAKQQFGAGRFWTARCTAAQRTRGQPPLFETPDDLWAAAVEYFEWVAENPLLAADTVKFQGRAKLVAVPKLRAMTINGLTLFLGISVQSWHNYRAKDDFFEVVTQVEKVIHDQKFSGAAAELLNPNIIARDLGLVDKSEVAANVRAVVSADPLSAEDWEASFGASQPAEDAGDMGAAAGAATRIHPVPGT
jgi:hypothetical protein